MNNQLDQWLLRRSLWVESSPLSMTTIRRYLAFAALGLFSVSSGIAVTQKTDEKRDSDEPYRIRISRWADDASLTRDRKPVSQVKKGTKLELADLLKTGARNYVDVYCGALGLSRVHKNSSLKYVSFNPPLLTPNKDCEVTAEIKGRILHRVGVLTEKSKYLSKSGIKSTASKGTAYSIEAEGDKYTVIVAEGKVEVSMAGKSTVLAIAARQKAALSTTLPAQASPVTLSDESTIRDLLSLPIVTILGYGDPVELRRKDATRIVTLRVYNAVVVERDSEAKATWRPRSIVVTEPTTFFSVDEAGTKRKIGVGLKFLAVDPRGKIVLGSDSNNRIVAMKFDGTDKRVINDTPTEFISLAPDASRLLGTQHVPGVNAGRYLVSIPFIGSRIDLADQPLPDDAKITALWVPRHRLQIAIASSKGSHILELDAGYHADNRPWRYSEDGVFDSVEASGSGRWLIIRSQAGVTLLNADTMNS